jgi:hypothetical protein
MPGSPQTAKPCRVGGVPSVADVCPQGAGVPFCGLGEMRGPQSGATVATLAPPLPFETAQEVRVVVGC